MVLPFISWHSKFNDRFNNEDKIISKINNMLTLYIVKLDKQ
jgi:hypothetical protein